MTRCRAARTKNARRLLLHTCPNMSSAPARCQMPPRIILVLKRRLACRLCRRSLTTEAASSTAAQPAGWWDCSYSDRCSTACIEAPIRLGYGCSCTNLPWHVKNPYYSGSAGDGPVAHPSSRHKPAACAGEPPLSLDASGTPSAHIFPLHPSHQVVPIFACSWHSVTRPLCCNCIHVW